MSQTITSVYPVFQDLDGEPLELGYIYIGTAGLDAFSNQITVYWDKALTDPVTQPIRTKGGYPNNGGSYAAVYTGANDYSITINDSKNLLVSSSLNRVKTGVGSLQNGYENGSDILTNATELAVVVQRGSGADTDAVFQVENGAGTVVANIRGDNKVGLGTGTGTPQGNLHVRSATSGANSVNASADEGVFEGSADSGITILSGTASNSSVYFGNSVDQVEGGLQYNHSTNLMSFRTNGAFSMYLDSTGALGVGETTPLGKLHVKSADSGVTAAHLDGDELVVEGSGNSGLSILSGNASTSNIMFGDDNDNNVGQIQYTHSTTNSMGFYTEATLAMTIDSSQQLGIGETSPLGKLHVRTADSGVSSADAGADEIIAEGSANSGISVLSGLTSNGALYFGNSGDAVEGGIQYNHSSKLLSFRTNGAFGAYLDTTGAFGIGETAPQGKLHVKSADAGATTPAAGADELILENSGNCGMSIISGGASICQINMGDAGIPGGGIILYDNNSAFMALSTGGTEKMRVASSGDVGIGETGTALGKLHVKTGDAGVVTISADANELVIEGSGAAGMTVLAGSGNTAGIHFGDNGAPSDGYFKYDNPNRQMIFGSGGANAWIMDSNRDFHPGADNTYTVGNASFRLNEIFCTNATINTSDEREKTIQADNETVLDVIDSISIKAFKWNDAIEEKGDAARIHYGIMAQDLKAAFEAVNLDPSAYSVFCYDSWEESTGPNGETIPAGDRYGVRYEELYALKVACLERRISNLENV